MTPGEAAVRNASVACDGGERRLEILGVGLGGPRVAHGDRPVAGRRPAPGSPGVAEDALGQLGEVHEVPVLERLARAAEPGQAILHVGGVARLAELAVVDHVHARVRLLPHDLGHRGPGAGGEGGAVDRHPFLPGEHRPHEVLGPRQAAGVRGEEAVAALSHAKSAGRRDRRRGAPGSWRAKALPDGEGEPRQGPAGDRRSHADRAAWSRHQVAGGSSTRRLA